MNDNVQIADESVSKIRTMLVSAGDKRLVPIQTMELVDVLHKLERLAVLERHLYNLCSDGYKYNAS